MKILVTGGTGFLGSHLVPRLLAGGHTVRVMARNTLPPSWDSVEHIQGDLKDGPSVSRALENIEVVYHLAGKVSFETKDGPAMYQLHVECTRELLQKAKRANVKRFILASTSGTIAVSKDNRIRTEEDDYPITTVGQWPYYLSKIYEEKLALEYCRAEHLPLLVLNPSLLLGPGDERLSSCWTVMKFLNRQIPVMPNGGLSFVDVRDAAQVFAEALTQGELYGRHLVGLNMSLADFFGRLERLSGVPAPKVRLPSQANVLGAKLLEKLAHLRGIEPALSPPSVEIGEHFFYLNADKAEALLRFRPRDPQETLFDTVQYILSKMPPQALPGTKGRLFSLRH